MFQTEFAEKIKTHIKRPISYFSRKTCRYGIAGRATDDNIIQRMRFPR